MWIFDLTFCYKMYVLLIALTANLIDFRSRLDIASPVIASVLLLTLLWRCSSCRGRRNWLRLTSFDKCTKMRYLHLQNKKKSGEGDRPSPDPSPLGGGNPLPRPPPPSALRASLGTFGPSIVRAKTILVPPTFETKVTPLG